MCWLLHHHYSSPNKPSIYQTFVWLVVVCRGLCGKRLYSIQLQCVVMGSICQAPGRLRKARKSEGLHSHTATVNQTTEPCSNGISAGTTREQKAMQWLWSSCCINEGLPSDLLINHSWNFSAKCSSAPPKTTSCEEHSILLAEGDHPIYLDANYTLLLLRLQLSWISVNGKPPWWSNATVVSFAIQAGKEIAKP